MDELIKILVIDDDDSGREALTILLRSVGYAVSSASTGESAINMIDRGGVS